MNQETVTEFIKCFAPTDAAATLAFGAVVGVFTLAQAARPVVSNRLSGRKPDK